MAKITPKLLENLGRVRTHAAVYAEACLSGAERLDCLTAIEAAASRGLVARCMHRALTGHTEWPRYYREYRAIGQAHEASLLAWV